MNDLLETPEWRRFWRYAKKKKKINHLYIDLIKYSSLVLRFHMTFLEDTERLDNENGNSLCRNVRAIEMKHLLEYKIFKSLGIEAPIPDG